MKIIDLFRASWAIVPDRLEEMPLIYDDLSQAYETGFAAGRAQEVERIRSIHDMSYPGHEKLIEQLMFDGKTSQGEAAMAVLAAERKIRAAELLERQVVTVESKIKARWESNASLRSDFENNFDRYAAYAKNQKLALVEGSRD